MLYQGKIIWQGPVGQLDDSGNPYVDQFIHGRAEGPIKLDVRAAYGPIPDPPLDGGDESFCFAHGLFRIPRGSGSLP